MSFALFGLVVGRPYGSCYVKFIEKWAYCVESVESAEGNEENLANDGFLFLKLKFHN